MPEILPFLYKLIRALLPSSLPLSQTQVGAEQEAAPILRRGGSQGRRWRRKRQVKDSDDFFFAVPRRSTFSLHLSLLSRSSPSTHSSKRAKSGAAANDDNGGGDGSNEQQPRRRAPTAPRLPASTPAPEAAQLSADHPPPLPRAPRDPSAFVALSWNVPGLNSMLARDPLALSRLVAAEGADALCLQEHKLQPERTKPGAAGRDGAKEIFGDCCLGAAGGGCASSHRANGNKLGLPGWHVTWACSTKKLGYSGVAIASRVEPLSVRVGIGNGDVAAGDGAVSSSASSSSHPHDVEGRFVAVEFERFWLATAYVPNSSEGLKRLKYRVGEDFSPARATAASGLPPGTPCW